MQKLTWQLVVVTALSLSGIVACSDSTMTTAPDLSSPSPGLSAAVLAAMNESIDDEYHAEAVYMGVLDDFGNVLPFANIVNAEERHSLALARLYRAYGLNVPANGWSEADVPRFETLRAACSAAVEAELSNIAMYDRFFELNLPDDVARVFENNRRASLQSHLPAFQNCAA